MDRTALFIVIAVMLVGGTVAAVAWWQLADYFFPGTARKTGQRILGRDDPKPAGPPPSATIVRGFDEPAEKP